MSLAGRDPAQVGSELAALAGHSTVEHVWVDDPGTDPVDCVLFVVADRALTAERTATALMREVVGTDALLRCRVVLSSPAPPAPPPCTTRSDQANPGTA